MWIWLDFQGSLFAATMLLHVFFNEQTKYKVFINCSAYESIWMPYGYQLSWLIQLQFYAWLEGDQFWTMAKTNAFLFALVNLVNANWNQNA